MTEGPEVKLIADRVRHLLEGKILKGFNIIKGPYNDSVDEKYKRFREVLCQIKEIINDEKQKIVILSVETKGKLIHMELQIMKLTTSNQWKEGQYIYFVCHLGMTGNWYTDESKHTTMELLYSNDDSDYVNTIYLDDVRMQSSVDFVNADEIEGKLDALGPDVFDSDFTLHNFINSVGNFNDKEIVQVISDQSVISGIGNIYRSEALYLAKIHPLRKCGTLSREEIERLYMAIKFVVRKSFLDKGLFNDNNSIGYRSYVYKRTSDNDGNKVSTFRISGRTVWYVEKVQK